MTIQGKEQRHSVSDAIPGRTGSFLLPLLASWAIEENRRSTKTGSWKSHFGCSSLQNPDRVLRLGIQFDKRLPHFPNRCFRPSAVAPRWKRLTIQGSYPSVHVVLLSGLLYCRVPNLFLPYPSTPVEEGVNWLPKCEWMFRGGARGLKTSPRCWFERFCSHL